MGLFSVYAGAVELDQAQAGVKSSVHSRLPPASGEVITRYKLGPDCAPLLALHHCVLR